MDDVDLSAALEQADPFSEAEVSLVAPSLQRLVRSVAALDHAARRRRHRRFVIGGIGVGVVLLAGTGASALPGIIEWAPWAPDVVLDRAFPISDGTGLTGCVIVMRVEPDSATGDENTDAHVADARAFLQGHDWSTLEVTLGQVSAFDRVALARQGQTEAGSLTREVTEQIAQAMTQAGHLGHGVALSASERCDPRPDQ
ncbi:hypothetical protein E3O44_17315 [Cryobacterium algoricola]|uniref:Uncharacterized protein n=1 Tax=Cryobacterium algoricola TaxID=1259183 RepID=A0ABY2IAH1_9MICO|nr:hypothetical protein [Cryobacterium algoricola]TFB83630.1 hypothetical protein E3O44_17315 [Cryobacterium algoricola]